MVPVNAPPRNCFKCDGPGHWASMCPVKAYAIGGPQPTLGVAKRGGL